MLPRLFQTERSLPLLFITVGSVGTMEFTVCVLLAGVLALCAVEGVAQDFSPEGDATCLVSGITTNVRFLT